MELALVFSSRCNAACLHCGTSCGPTRTESLSTEQMLHLIDEAAAVSCGERFAVHLTGGEPFLDFSKLEQVILHAKKAGAAVTCVTNGYWASSEVEARNKLLRVIDAGLVCLGLSVSRFHQEFVPLRRVRLILEIAAELGLETLLKAAVTQSDLSPEAGLDIWRRLLPVDRVNTFPVLPYLRDGASLQESEFHRKNGLPSEPCPETLVTVQSDGAVTGCCSVTGTHPFLKIGDVADDSLEVLRRRLRMQSKFRILRDKGPIAFAQEAIRQGKGDRLRSGYGSPCDLCHHIARDTELSRIANDYSATQDVELLWQAMTWLEDVATRNS